MDVKELKKWLFLEGKTSDTTKHDAGGLTSELATTTPGYNEGAQRSAPPGARPTPLLPIGWGSLGAWGRIAGII